MKKYIKITIILLLIGLGLMQCSKVYAKPEDPYSEVYEGGRVLDGGDGSIEDIDEIGAKYTDVYNPKLEFEELEAKTFKEKVGAILAIIRTIGIILSVIVLMILGIKEMVAGVEERSVIKKAMPGYILGVVLVTAITVLPSIIYDIVNSF